ncbi:hypothetical protein NQ176_g864 [Zarea fungicola]|uniref:Uncharacterized protein n=1 Tax=Zarea fungicola TaxID=93591 RepID=A0ACC1NVW6_9HYPO|nr:hypothetical protein NQ176_g864 [Lecanicillium fungicola]
MKFAIHLLALAASNCVALAVTIPPSTSASSDLAKVNDVESDFSTLQKRTNPPELFNGAVFTANTIRFTVRNIQEQARSEFTKLDTMKSAFGTCATSASEYIHSSHGPLGESYFTKLFGNIEFFGQLQDSRFGYLWDNMPQSIMHDMALAALNSAVDLYANDGISYVQWDVVSAAGALIYTFALYGKRR